MTNKDARSTMGDEAEDAPTAPPPVETAIAVGERTDGAIVVVTTMKADGEPSSVTGNLVLDADSAETLRDGLTAILEAKAKKRSRSRIAAAFDTLAAMAPMVAEKLAARVASTPVPPAEG